MAAGFSFKRHKNKTTKSKKKKTKRERGEMGTNSTYRKSFTLGSKEAETAVPGVARNPHVLILVATVQTKIRGGLEKQTTQTSSSSSPGHCNIFFFPILLFFIFGWIWLRLWPRLRLLLTHSFSTQLDVMGPRRLRLRFRVSREPQKYDIYLFSLFPARR